MRFAWSEEQEALQREARRLVGAHRRDDPELWRRAVALGWSSLLVPEEFGGAGLGFVELAAVLEELGRALALSPLFATALATFALGEGGNEDARREWLPKIAEGATATVAFGDGVTARDDRLEGRARFVVDGASAELVLVEAGGALFAVRGAELTRQAMPALDETRPLAELRLDGVRAARLPATNLVARTRDRAKVALAVESVGGGARCLELSVEYAKTRVQFGRPIGSFQAVKHTLANLLVELETARAAALWAAWAASVDDGELPVAAALARATCGEAFYRCAADTIQIHGGIGFTWEHDAHRYFRRARSGLELLGDLGDERARIARHLGL
jgi:alkylation response protein AidB-like acyl-CoA dehydrogenase